MRAERARFFLILPTNHRYFPRNFPPVALRGKGAPAGQRPPQSGETTARLRPRAVLAGHMGLGIHIGTRLVPRRAGECALDIFVCPDLFTKVKALAAMKPNPVNNFADDESAAMKRKLEQVQATADLYEKAPEAKAFLAANANADAEAAREKKRAAKASFFAARRLALDNAPCHHDPRVKFQYPPLNATSPSPLP